jgi:hypothetical protein
MQTAHACVSCPTSVLSFSFRPPFLPSETLALSVIAEKALPPLVAALSEESEDHLKAALAWALGQVGRHTPDHAKAVSDTGVLGALVTLEAEPGGSEDLRTKCRRALKSIIGKLTHLPALDALVHRPLPEGVMKMVLEQVRGQTVPGTGRVDGQQIQAKCR